MTFYQSQPHDIVPCPGYSIRNGRAISTPAIILSKKSQEWT